MIIFSNEYLATVFCAQVTTFLFCFPDTDLGRHSEIPPVRDKTTQTSWGASQALLLFHQPFLYSYLNNCSLWTPKGCCAAMWRSQELRSDCSCLAEGPVLCYFVPELIGVSLFTINFRSQYWTPSFCKVFRSVTQVGERTFNSIVHPIKFTWPHKRWRAVFFEYKLRQISYRVSVNVCWKAQQEP